MKGKSKVFGLNEKDKASSVRKKSQPKKMKSSSLNENNSIQPAIAELEKLYEAMAVYFRDESALRASELVDKPQPRIVIQSRGRRRDVAGYFSANRWKDRKDEAGDVKPIHEITVCAEYLAKPLAEIIGTLIHEMVHMYCHYADIKDVGKDGRYHNQKFRDACLEVGLLVEKDERIGWARTSLGPALEKKVFSLNINEDAFSVFRIAPAEQAKQPTKMKKWVCGCTPNPTIVRCATELTATCTTCGYTFANVDRGETPQLPALPPLPPVQEMAAKMMGIPGFAEAALAVMERKQEEMPTEWETALENAIPV
jgi:hypothetical protein